MTRFGRIALTVFAIYALGYCVTYGIVYNEKYQLAKASYKSLGEPIWISNGNMAAHPSAFIWPLYWPVRLSIWATS